MIGRRQTVLGILAGSLAAGMAKAGPSTAIMQSPLFQVIDGPSTTLMRRTYFNRQGFEAPAPSPFNLAIYYTAPQTISVSDYRDINYPVRMQDSIPVSNIEQAEERLFDMAKPVDATVYPIHHNRWSSGQSLQQYYQFPNVTTLLFHKIGFHSLFGRPPIRRSLMMMHPATLRALDLENRHGYMVADGRPTCGRWMKAATLTNGHEITFWTNPSLRIGDIYSAYVGTDDASAVLLRDGDRLGLITQAGGIGVVASDYSQNMVKFLVDCSAVA